MNDWFYSLSQTSLKSPIIIIVIIMNRACLLGTSTGPCINVSQSRNSLAGNKGISLKHGMPTMD
jgi:hypothetical protein